MNNIQTLIYISVATGLLAELLLVANKHFWPFKTVLSTIGGIGALTSLFINSELLLINLILVGIVATRVFNIARLTKGRMHQKYASRAGLRTILFLATFQTITLLTARIYGELALNSPAGHAIAMVFAGLLLATAAILAYSVTRTIVKTRHIINAQFFSDQELPTVSVLIPARNETTDLQECLTSLLANDYPKLEVIVYDDCSQIKAADVIKNFAQKGVRFIKGVEPDSHWLAKNKAYQVLLEQATGEYVVFCGVDTRFSASAIRSLVTTMFNRNKTMLSILPMRHYGTPDSAIIQPMRYWWQLVPPRRLFNRPPVLSTCWAVRRKELLALGGFAAVSRAIVPEMYLARAFANQKDNYGFIRADKELDIQTVKSLPEQHDTAIRTRYPLVKRRPENVFIVILAELLFFGGLPFLILYGFITSNAYYFTVGIIGVALTVYIQYMVVRVSSPAHIPYIVALLPFVVLADISTLIFSMYKYEFSNVIWKERNVCIPAMHVVPKLPELQ